MSSLNIQQVYRRRFILECDYSNVTLLSKLFLRHECSPAKFCFQAFEFGKKHAWVPYKYLPLNALDKLVFYLPNLPCIDDTLLAWQKYSVIISYIIVFVTRMCNHRIYTSNTCFRSDCDCKRFFKCGMHKYYPKFSIN